MTRRLVVLAAALGGLLATSAQAQTVGSHPAADRGTRSLALQINSSPQIGLWMRHSDRTDLGLEFSLNARFGSRDRNYSVGVMPGMKRYVSSDGPLAPYTYFAIPLFYGRTDYEEVPDYDYYSAGALLALGMDWFPIPRVSIGGHAGVQALYQNPSNDEGVLNIGTATSAVRVHLYF